MGISHELRSEAKAGVRKNQTDDTILTMKVKAAVFVLSFWVLKLGGLIHILLPHILSTLHLEIRPPIHLVQLPRIPLDSRKPVL